MAHPDEPLDSAEKKLLLDDDGTSHAQWQYECPVVHLYYQYCVWSTILGLPYYKHSMFYLKIEGVVTQTEYRDGICGICRAGRPLEAKILTKQELSEHEFAQYLFLKIHKVYLCVIYFIQSRDMMNESIAGLDIHTFYINCILFVLVIVISVL